MVSVNKNYKNIKESYLFSDIAKKVADFSAANPDIKIIRMGIGDVTRPLCESVISEMSVGVREMGKAETFHGYGPEQGYSFIKEPIKAYYAESGVELDLDEIFI